VTACPAMSAGTHKPSAGASKSINTEKNAIMVQLTSHGTGRNFSLL